MTTTAATPSVEHPSPRLYNEDLAPATERRWGAFSITSVWFACMHNMGQYTMAAAMMFAGLSPWAVVLGCMIGFGITFLGSQLISLAGQRHGLSYPVLARASFGVYGANLPALVRAVVAVAWYGIQTYLASRAVVLLLLIIQPSWSALDHGGWLGLSPLGWFCFLGLWALQLVVVTHGIERVRKFQNYAGATVSLVMLAIAVALCIKAGWHLDFSLGRPLPLSTAINHVFTDASLWIACFATLMLNMCDFTRMSPTRRAVTRGNFFGLLVNGLLFMVLVVVNTVAAATVYHRAFTDPAELLSATGNKALIAVGAVLFVFATIGVNVVANVVSPAYDLANAFPSKINFTRGALITCVLALLVMPWKLYSSTVAITYFLGTLGAVLGPLFGVIVTDYYLSRRGRLSVPELYLDGPGSRYFYRGGWNPRALAAFVPAAAVSAALVLVPALSSVATYGWFVGVAIAALIYRVLTADDDPASATVAHSPAGDPLGALATD